MDNFDAVILRLLQKNGRMSWLELGEKTRLSASAVQRRVQAMEKSGVIKHFSLQIDEKEVGNEVKAMVMVNVNRQDVKTARKFRQRLADYPEVQAMHMLSGTVDFMLEVVAKDIKSFASFMEEKVLSLPGVKDASSSIVLGTMKEHQSMIP